MNDTKKTIVVTHSGSFHADDVFGVAALHLYLGGDFQLIRTRDEKLISTGDYVLDVGAKYDPAAKRFDHHQTGGAGLRQNGIPYASFGLIWKEYGGKICGGGAEFDDVSARQIADMVDKKLVQPIDAIDNGVDMVKLIFDDVSPYTISDIISSFIATWDESSSRSGVNSVEDKEADTYKRFNEAVILAKTILLRKIIRAQSRYRANSLVDEAYSNAEDKRLIVLKDHYPWRDVLGNRSEPLYVVYPEKSNDTWHVRAVSQRSSFRNRKDFPESWAGKQGAQFVEVVGIPDVIFCHNARFLAVAKSKESAIRLAKIAIEA